MTDKVLPSFSRTINSREMAAAVRYSGGSDGWVVPSTERLVEDSEGNLDAGALNAFGKKNDGLRTIAAETFSSPADPRGIIWDGGFLWEVDNSDDELYEYDRTDGYTGDSISPGVTSGGRGLAYDGSEKFMTHSDGSVYRVEGVVNAEDDFDISSETSDPTGISWDGSNFYVIGGTTVYEYDASFNHTSNTFDISGQTTSPKGMCWDGSSFWIVDGTTVYEYDASFSYQSNSFSVSGQDSSPWGIEWDGSHFWITGDNTDTFYEYDASGDHTLAVTIDDGEALVGGAHLATDDSTPVDLAASTNNQTVYLGWKDSSEDTVLVDTASAFTSDDPKIPVWEFDTDASSVTSSTDLRVTQRRISTERLEFDDAKETGVIENAGATYEIDLHSGTTFLLTLTDNTTFSFSGVDTDSVNTVTLRLQQDGTGSRTPSWPSNVNWPDDGTEPSWSTAANAIDYVTFLYDPDRDEWDGFLGGLDFA